MGSCCAPAKKVTDKTPTHINQRQLFSTFKQIKSIKDQSQIAKQRQLYRITQSRILIYNIDLNVAWIEDISMRSRISFHYQSVKTGPNELFLLQDRLSLLINVDLFTGLRKADPPFPIYRSMMTYSDRKVYVASENLLVLDLDKNVWVELVKPSGYALESGIFVMENKLYLLGGVREGAVRQEVYVFSLLAQSWLAATVKLPVPMRLPTCVVLNSQVLVCCGCSPLNEPLSNAYLFDLFHFKPTHSMTLSFQKPPLMAICYNRTAFFMREDGILACWQEGDWFELDAEGICSALSAPGETIETSVKDNEELEAARALIPKRPPRPDRLYTYYIDTETEGNRPICLLEMNTLSLESREIDGNRLMGIPKGAGSCVLPGGKVLFAGGFIAGREVDVSMEWDPLTGNLLQWKALPRVQALVTMLVVGEKVFGLGGVSEVVRGKRQPRETYFQDCGGPETLWLLRESTPYPVIYASLCTLGPSIFSIGGICLFPTSLSSGPICEYSLSTQTWRALEITYPNPDLSHLSLINTLQHRVICFGGIDLATGETPGETWSFDGKGFKPRAKSRYLGKAALGCVEYNGKRVISVDKTGAWHRFTVETGIWETEKDP